MSKEDQHNSKSDPCDVSEKPVADLLQENGLSLQCSAGNVMMEGNNQEEYLLSESTQDNPEIKDRNNDTKSKYSRRGDKNDVVKQNEGILRTRKKTVRPNCWYFTNQGYCRFGQNCRYIHPRRFSNSKSARENVPSRNTYSGIQPFKSKDYVKVPGVTNNKISSDYMSPKENTSESPSEIPKQIKSDRSTCNYQNFHANLNSPSNSRLDTHSEQNRKPFKPQFNLGKESHQRSLVYYNSGRRAQKTNEASERTNNSRICYFFEKGFCRRGDGCKFLHSVDFHERNIADFNTTGNDEHSDNDHTCQQSKSSDSKLTKPYAKSIPITKQGLNLKDLSDVQLSDLRETEIQLLQKKFADFAVVSDVQDVFQVTFVPSDPDWSFDVKSVVIEVAFSKLYPREICHMEVVNKQGDLPPLLVKFLNKAIMDWLMERHQSCQSEGKVELICRPFLRWFDRNLEELFIIGLRKVKQHIEAKESGLEFVPFEELQQASGNKNRVPPDPERLCNASDNEYFIGNQAVEGTSCEADSESSIAFENSEKENVAPDSSEKEGNREESSMSTTQNKPGVPKFGIEVKLLDLELAENAAALTCQKIAITLQCSRCKTRHEISSPPRRCNSLKCTKCHQEMQVIFQTALLHQFSAVLGNLHLIDCQVVDIPLMECAFLIDCLNCNKQNSISGIHYGQQRIAWCLFCNKKLSVSTSSVKFHHLQPALISGTTSRRLIVEKKDKKVKDPAIQEGKPLPDCGACKHYKKSYRWLRFPCCGKAYPCDVCHYEKETDHEMKYANRMICGFCAKEQAYSGDRPCINCSSNMTKRSGPHWEGGRGCRDKIKMSRDDRQKYAGSNKTMSRRSQNLKPNKGK